MDLRRRRFGVLRQCRCGDRSKRRSAEQTATGFRLHKGVSRTESGAHTRGGRRRPETAPQRRRSIVFRSEVKGRSARPERQPLRLGHKAAGFVTDIIRA